MLQNEVNLVPYMIERAWEKGMKVVMKPSLYDEAVSACDFSKISMFLINEVEGTHMTGETDLERILEKLRRDYPKAKIVLTLGEKGSVYQEGEKQYRQGVFPVKTIDTTAAGDTFTGYFISSVIDGLSVGYWGGFRSGNHRISGNYP